MKKALVIALSLGFAASAFAEVKIEGNNRQTVTVNGVAANVAVGANNRQKLGIGNVNGKVTIKGNNTQTVTVNGVAANVAVGANNRQALEIGSVSSDGMFTAR